MSVFRLAAVVCSAAVLTACASGPKMAEVQSSIPALKAGQGRIYFYRSNSMMGAAIQPAIKVNGEEVGSSKPGGFFFVDQAPGPKEVTTSTEVEKKLTFTLGAGDVRYVKTTISSASWPVGCSPNWSTSRSVPTRFSTPATSASR